MSSELGLKCCEILGIDSNGVSALTIELKAGAMAEVHIKRFLTEEDGQKIEQILEHYGLVPIEEL